MGRDAERMGRRMKIVIPMAGEGKRFVDQGYKIHKPVLPVIYRKNGEKCPMTVCSVMDLPDVCKDGDNVAFVMRDFHRKDGVDQEIRKWYPKAAFFETKDLTEGQVCTCLLAEPFIDQSDELLIAACDNGIVYNSCLFDQLRGHCDLIVFTFRHDIRVCEHPDDFGWAVIDEKNWIKGMSVKKHISDTPQEDHALVGTFWFRRGSIFLEAAEKMIREDDRIHHEFYVDQVVKHALELGYSAKVFEVDRFINYGTPKDYENYHQTIAHIREFLKTDSYLGIN